MVIPEELAKRLEAMVAVVALETLNEAADNGDKGALQTASYLPRTVAGRMHGPLLAALRFCYSAGVTRGRTER